VEVGYEQLAEAEQLASALTKVRGQEIRILGWFHSHPHITVLPSHVDLRTQAQYQAMDAGFLGLICAVFQDDPKQQKGRVEITAFQSVPGGGGGGGGREGGRAVMMDLDDDFIRIDDEDSVAACVHHDVGAAAAGMGGGFERKGIPISLVPLAGGGGGREGGSSDGPTTDAMRCVVSLQEVLMQEERFFYEAAARTNLRNNTTNISSSSNSSSSSRAGDVHALYNAAVYGKALSSLLEESALPLMNTLETVLLNVRREKERVQRAVEKLEEEEQQRQRRRGGMGGAGVKEEERGGGGGSGMMDVDDMRQAGNVSSSSLSPYSASVLAGSRPEILKRAAEGWQMRRMDGGGEGDDVLVSLTREYPLVPFGGGGFGEWRVSVGEEKGRLTRVSGNGNGNHTVIFGFMVAREEGGGGEEEKETTVRMLGSEEAVAFWCRRVQPIVCPGAGNLLPP